MTVITIKSVITTPINTPAMPAAPMAARRGERQTMRKTWRTLAIYIYLQKPVFWWTNCRTWAALRPISHLAGILWIRSPTRHRTCSRPSIQGRYQCNTHIRWSLRRFCFRCCCTDRKPFLFVHHWHRLQRCTLLDVIRVCVGGYTNSDLGTILNENLFFL